MTFRGRFSISLRVDYTVEIPSVFVCGFSDSLAIAACAAHIGLYPRDVWENFERDVFDRDDMQVLQYFLLTAQQVEIGPGGRLTLPADFCHQARLDTGVDNMVVIGSGDCLELWSRQRYDRYFM